MKMTFITPYFDFIKDVGGKPQQYRIMFPRKIEPMNSLEGDLIKNHSGNMMMIFEINDDRTAYIYKGVEVV